MTDSERAETIRRLTAFLHDRALSVAGHVRSSGKAPRECVSDGYLDKESIKQLLEQEIPTPTT